MFSVSESFSEENTTSITLRKILSIFHTKVTSLKAWST